MVYFNIENKIVVIENKQISKAYNKGEYHA